MSNQLDPFSDLLNIETIKTIDQLNLPIMKKHHIRILAHCLIILRSLSKVDKPMIYNENLIRSWCYDQSQVFNDEKFNDIFFEQIASTAKKLYIFSQNIGKSINDLDIQDLVRLAEEG